ncbi:hypothetical protein F5B22DRAFT_599079 [Xylaria bambusicola]|uniref:uncharacterized protein n=1 Tax=Xylaria bambusicola TaxID=326684 RepID=UPI002008BA38|nr:uncharacterized protein F5B22DRAFT_599079 [Xylaria bambusicola]KAI0518416.1 hypothetical protein F5B22DRAFT_599079 [Xylaria bambusicola]
MTSTYGRENFVEGTWQDFWGVRFKWSSKHLTPKQLKPLTYSYDKIATDAVDRLHEIASLPDTKTPPPDEETEETAKTNGGKKPRWDMYGLMKEYASNDETIGRLWNEVHTIPEWVDWDQIERGQKIFWRYGGPAISTLTFLSLLGGMGSARTVETLDRTGGFDAKVVRRRLLETTQHTLNVHRDLKSIQPGGDGFVNSVRVRLLHSTIRRRILQMASQRPGYYNISKYGIPINDLDSIGTINTFSTTMIWMGLPRQGIYMRRQEILDYLALWRYIAHLMGTPHAWMATPESARSMMESLVISEIRPSKASANLANNIITGLERRPPTYASREFMCAQTYWLNGRDLAASLEIERPSVYYSALVFGQCLFFATLSYINRSFSWLDERNINLVRRVFYTVLLEDKSKGGLGYVSRFSFKYIPAFDRMSTERGVATAGSVSRPGIERTALLSLISFSGLACVCAWYAFKMLIWIFGDLF